MIYAFRLHSGPKYFNVRKGVKIMKSYSVLIAGFIAFAGAGFTPSSNSFAVEMPSAKDLSAVEIPAINLGNQYMNESESLKYRDQGKRKRKKKGRRYKRVYNSDYYDRETYVDRRYESVPAPTPYYAPPVIIQQEYGYGRGYGGGRNYGGGYERNYGRGEDYGRGERARQGREGYGREGYARPQYQQPAQPAPVQPQPNYPPRQIYQERQNYQPPQVAPPPAAIVPVPAAPRAVAPPAYQAPRLPAPNSQPPGALQDPEAGRR